MRFVLAVYPSELPLGVLLLVAGFVASRNGLEQHDWSLFDAGLLWIALGYAYPLITTNIQYVRHRAADAALPSASSEPSILRRTRTCVSMCTGHMRGVRTVRIWTRRMVW